MRTLEDRLIQASDEARLRVNQIDDRSTTSIRTRQQHRRVVVGTMVVAGVLGLSGLSAFIAQDPAGQTVGTDESPSTTISQAIEESVSTTTQAPVPASADADADADLRFYSGDDDELTWDWTAQAAALRADGNTTVPELNGIRQKLATVAEAVPAIGDATVLMFGSSEFYEEAFFVLEDGTDTMVYIGWQEYDGEMNIRFPEIDDKLDFIIWNDAFSVAYEVTDHVIDFAVDAGTQIATIRFFQLSDIYGSLPLVGRADSMNVIFDAVLTALNLPADSAGRLLDEADKGILPRPPLPAEIPDDLIASQTSASEAPPLFLCGEEPSRGEIIENGATFGTSTDALWGFLRESISIETRLGFLTSGYTQIELPDGSIAFANLFEGDGTQSVTTVYTAPTDGAWVVAAWEGSGC